MSGSSRRSGSGAATQPRQEFEDVGIRKTECFSVEWPFVDFEERTLRVEGTTAKSYETRDLPLRRRSIKRGADGFGKKLQQMLEAMPERPPEEGGPK